MTLPPSSLKVKWLTGHSLAQAFGAVSLIALQYELGSRHWGDEIDDPIELATTRGERYRRTGAAGALRRPGISRPVGT
jgi:hypothetical protein